MNFHDDNSSFSIDNFKDHFVLVFDLTTLQDVTENCHYPELVRQTPRLEINFTFPLECVTEPFVLGKGMSLISVDKFGVVGQNI